MLIRLFLGNVKYMQIVIIDSNVFPTTTTFSFFFLFLHDSSGTFQMKSIDKSMPIMHTEKRIKTKSYSEPHYLEQFKMEWLRLKLSV